MRMSATCASWITMRTVASQSGNRKERKHRDLQDRRNSVRIPLTQALLRNLKQAWT